jgi:hypothetical protein
MGCQLKEERRLMRAIVAQLVAQNADAGQVAETAFSTWLAIEAALSPIVGQRAVAALYKRSLTLIRADYPWLSVGEGDAHREPHGNRSDDFGLLRTALSQQTSSNAIAAHRALLQTYLDLLTGLLGESLTERLLRSVCDTLSSDDAQETSS